MVIMPLVLSLARNVSHSKGGGAYCRGLKSQILLDVCLQKILYTRCGSLILGNLGKVLQSLEICFLLKEKTENYMVIELPPHPRAGHRHSLGAGPQCACLRVCVAAESTLYPDSFITWLSHRLAPCDSLQTADHFCLLLKMFLYYKLI
ncbi:hypothetical protein HJG60_010680 [Phyllostomus discolor]|uniref:Uncharacterized protein n=1 Tax=Phyllostomus discolor TaxID=89673 RepID=A0A834EF17_9CHIR|nr:hypothetical protein HJG60_010680 [Phyllostomus discolor]